MLDFNSEGLKKLHFFKTDAKSMFVIASYTEEQKELVTQMEQAYQVIRFNTYQLAEWCDEMQLEYRVLADGDGIES